MSVPVALPAAFAYGVADFAGGLAARRASALAVTVLAQVAGLVTLVIVLVLAPLGGTPSSAGLAIGGLGGLAGAAGLLLYLRGLAHGPMGVVAPLSAMVGAGLPLLVGIAGGERPAPAALLAIAVALVAILLATAGTRGDGAAGHGLALGLGAGVGFGLFFVALDATPADSGFWPLVAGRTISVSVLALLLVVRGTHRRPFGGAWRLTVLSGVLDIVANAGFLLATRLGGLGVSAVVVSLYPVLVLLLARVVLRERLTALQLTSAGLALGASVVLAATG